MTPGEGILRLPPAAGRATKCPALGPASVTKRTFGGCIRTRTLAQHQRTLVVLKPQFDVLNGVCRRRCAT